MATSEFLGLDLLTAGQAGAEVIFNEAVAALDALHDRGQSFVLWEDCAGTPSTTGSPLVTASSGAGAAVSATTFTGGTNTLGVWSLSTGTTTTGYSSVHPASASLLLLGGGAVRFKARVRFEDLSDGTDTYTMRAGLGDSQVAGQPTDGALFRYTHGTNSGKFECVTRSNGTETASDSGITVAADTWYVLEAVVAADGTGVTFSIDGAQVAENTTNIPTAAGRETSAQVSIIKSAGTTARLLHVDYLGLQVVFTTAR